MKRLIQRFFGNYLAYCALNRAQACSLALGTDLSKNQKIEAITLGLEVPVFADSNDVAELLRANFLRSSWPERALFLSPHAQCSAEETLSIDVTQTVAYPYNTGIQRVTRETLRPLEKHFGKVLPYRIPTYSTRAVLLSKAELIYLFDFHPLKKSLKTIASSIFGLVPASLSFILSRVVAKLFERIFSDQDFRELDAAIRSTLAADYVSKKTGLIRSILGTVYSKRNFVTSGAKGFTCEFISADNHFEFYDRRIDGWMEMYFVVHDLLPLEQPESFDGKPEFSRFLGLVDRGAGTICESKTTQSSLERWRTNFSPEAHKGRTICAYLGQSFSAEKSKMKPGDEVSKAICVGTFEPRKNQLRILLAVARLWAQGCKVKVLFVGNPGWRSSELFAAKAALDPEDLFSEVEIAISDTRLEQRYAESDFFIQSSLGEGFGLPALEALGHGLPGVISRGGSLAEIDAVTGGCIAVDPTVDSEIEAAILRLCNGEERSRLAKSIKNVDKFSWETFSSSVYQLVKGSSR